MQIRCSKKKLALTYDLILFVYLFCLFIVFTPFLKENFELFNCCTILHDGLEAYFIILGVKLFRKVNLYC